MTAVIYARYSTDNQREESIEGQIRECTAYGRLLFILHYFYGTVNEIKANIIAVLEFWH